MTEEEAKTKLCPMLYAGGIVTACNLTKAGKAALREEILCKGSACIMWRWGVGDECGEYPNPDKHPITSGYCGLAGKP